MTTLRIDKSGCGKAEVNGKEYMVTKVFGTYYFVRKNYYSKTSFHLTHIKEAKRLSTINRIAHAHSIVVVEEV